MVEVGMQLAFSCSNLTLITGLSVGDKVPAVISFFFFLQMTQKSKFRKISLISNQEKFFFS